MTPGSRTRVGTTLPLVLSIASTVLCCDPILGLPAIVLAIQAKNAADMGSMDLAHKRARTSLVLASVGAGLGLLFELFEAFRYFTSSS